MIDLKDLKKIRRTNNPNKIDYRYKALCDKCGADRGYVSKRKANQLCRSCAMTLSHSNISDKTKAKMSASRMGKKPWNKGLVGVSKETSIKMSIKKKGSVPPNKGVAMKNEQKIKLSCSIQSIDVSDFKGFTTAPNKKDRNKIKDLELSDKTFTRDNHACQCCSVKGTALHAHHMNSFAHYPEQRFELDNLVTLCNHCHNLFHKKYGNGKATANTKEQFLEFQQYVKTVPKRDVILLCGAPASGKSWVGKQLTKYSYISHDDASSKNLIYSVLNADKPVIYDPTIGISTFMKNMSHYFNFKLVVIIEDEDVIKSRMLSRDGKITPTIEKRCKRMRQLSKKAIFSGTSEEVLKYLQA